MASSDDNHELIYRVSKGDADAFSKVYELYKDKVFAFAYTLTKSRETAEEVVQDVFLKLWERREQVRIEYSFAAYVKKVTYHQVIDFFRRAKKDQSLQEKLIRQMKEIRNSGEEFVLGRELDKVYKQAIEQLPPQQKKAFLLSREEDLSYEEIAQRLGISRNTVRNHLADAMKSIRTYVSTNSDMAIVIMAICIHRHQDW